MFHPKEHRKDYWHHTVFKNYGSLYPYGGWLKTSNVINVLKKGCKTNDFYKYIECYMINDKKDKIDLQERICKLPKTLKAHKIDAPKKSCKMKNPLPYKNKTIHFLENAAKRMI